MKKIVSLILSMIFIFIFTNASASETYDKYINALTEYAWEVYTRPAEIDNKTLELLYNIIIKKNGIIQLPNSDIQLFESPAGPIYITIFADRSMFGIAELIFNYDMESFILYNDGSALMFIKYIPDDEEGDWIDFG